MFTTVEQLIGLRSAFRAWGVETTTSASPFRFGQFTVEADNKGINLTRWDAGEVTRDDLLLPGHVWETVDRHVHGSLAMSETLAAAGLASSAGVLCVGPPGTGKSQLARIVATEVKGRATVLMATSWAVQRFLTPLFRLAGQLAPSVVVIDDLDLVVESRGAGAEQLHGFLGSMDEVMASREGVVVLASTNAPGSIDPAAVRASRFDAVIEMKAPGPQGRYRILERFLAAFPARPGPRGPGDRRGDRAPTCVTWLAGPTWPARVGSRPRPCCARSQRAGSPRSSPPAPTCDACRRGRLVSAEPPRLGA